MNIRAYGWSDSTIVQRVRRLPVAAKPIYNAVLSIPNPLKRHWQRGNVNARGVHSSGTRSKKRFRFRYPKFRFWRMANRIWTENYCVPEIVYLIILFRVFGYSITQILWTFFSLLSNFACWLLTVECDCGRLWGAEQAFLSPRQSRLIEVIVCQSSIVGHQREERALRESGWTLRVSVFEH